MNKNEPCLRCGSTNILSDGRVQGYGTWRSSVEVDTRPQARLFKGTRAMPLKARICGNCGHTELYVENARELWTMYRQNQGR